MTISVIVPTYNRAALLEQAIASIRAQSRPADEIIVVDDGSADATAAVAERLGPAIRYVWQPNRGAAAARNLGVRVATGGCLAFLDSDDVWLPHHLQTLVGRLESLPDATAHIVMSRVRLTDLRAMSLPIEPDVVTAPYFGAMLIPRGVWDRVGPVTESLRFAEDVDWILRARERGVRFELLDAVTALYRHHADNLTRDQSATQHGVAHALRISLVRRRASGGGLAPVGTEEVSGPPTGPTSARRRDRPLT